ncbi:hypothetical protein AOA80_03240 [Methanomassiliicoccales archaeon RumEn M1]|jgi:hydroxyacylglutathione hydrolase|nr:hypothetical protein AOA80_03240 [Methanomassiliicoccales archaeon RumEn M1]
MTVHVFQGTGYDSNCYLVSGERPVLVDTGTGINHDRLLRGLRSIVGDRRVDIVLTHRHFDHTGGGRRMAEALNAQVMMHPLDAAPVREGSAAGTSADVFGRTMEAVSIVEIEDGHVIDTGDHVLTVLHVPGHSAGGICLYEESTGILISGDTVFADGVGRWDLPTGDVASLVASIRKLSTLNLVDLYPGHGPCVQGNARRSLEGALSYLGGY